MCYSQTLYLSSPISSLVTISLILKSVIVLSLAGVIEPFENLMNSTKVSGRGLQHMGTCTHESIILYSVLGAFSLVKCTYSLAVLSFMNAMRAVTHCILRIFALEIQQSVSQRLEWWLGLGGETWPGCRAFGWVAVPAVHTNVATQEMEKPALAGPGSYVAGGFASLAGPSGLLQKAECRQSGLALEQGSEERLKAQSMLIVWLLSKLLKRMAGGCHWEAGSLQIAWTPNSIIFFLKILTWLCPGVSCSTWDL